MSSFSWIKLAWFLLKFLFALVLLLLVYVVVMKITSYIQVNTAFKETEENTIDIYLLTNGVHTDIVLPIENQHKNWREIFDEKQTKSQLNTGNYIAFGWGDKGFYLETPTWAELKAKTALKALFYMSSSAMHLTFYQKMAENADCIKISITPAQYKKIITFIEKSFQTDEKNSHLLIKDASYGNNDLFYEAKGRYSFLYTCNTWANECLKNAELKASLWTLTDGGIFAHYRK